jgi:hypothetical protein
MSKKLSDQIRDELIKFAKEHSIEAIYRGKSPEDNTPCFYMLKQAPYDRKFEDKLTSLELKLFPRESTMIMQFPISPDNVKDYPFMKELIYKSS